MEWSVSSGDDDGTQDRQGDGGPQCLSVWCVSTPARPALRRTPGGRRVRVVAVRGEIDHEVRDVLSEALMSEDGTVPPQRLVVDLSGVTVMDSSGINVFVAAYQQ